MKRIIILLFCAFALFDASAQNMYPYQNPDLSPEERTEDLLSRLTLEQKVSLMNYQSPAIPELGIPQYNWWSEALHGTARNGLATVFPQAIGMAASWNDALLSEVFEIASTEQRIKFNIARRKENVTRYNGLTVWTPNINIFRDPRWGRGQETYGEDPYLTTVMGRAVVNALQGPDTSKYDKLHACLKHFAIHSGPEPERHVFNVEEVSYRDLNETYLYAFERLVKTTDVKEVMCAYNAWEGDPCCGSDKLLIQILRKQWEYDGLVVTDCWAVRDFFTEGAHNIYPGNAPAATAASVRSGADLECGSAFPALVEAVKTGQLPEAEIDRALRRVLKARFELGEMDPQELVSWSKIPDEFLASDAHRKVALDMARETMTLLQNRGKLLPLRKDALYAVVGPNAADSVALWGNYNGFPHKTVTVLEGIKAKVGEDNVIYSPGCAIASFKADTGQYSQTAGNAHDAAIEAGGAAKTDYDLAALADADVIIYVGGLSPKLEGEEMRVNYDGFRGGDRTSIELPESQRRYVAALAALGKPVVFVNLSGSAVALEPEAEVCDAILQAWYPGEAGGTAVADVLFGDYNPSGKLPLTFYRGDNDVPDFNNYDMADRTYRYFKGKALFEFGHGLSYSKFKYRRAKYKDGVVYVTLKNCSKVAGDEVVQIYARNVADVEGPIKSLRGFKRVHLKPRQKVTVAIPVTLDLYNPQTGQMQETAGKHIIYYGGSSADSALKKIRIKI